MLSAFFRSRSVLLDVGRSGRGLYSAAEYVAIAKREARAGRGPLGLAGGSGSYDFHFHSSAFQANPVSEALFLKPVIPDFQMSGFGREYSGIDGTSADISASALAKSAARLPGLSSEFDCSISFVAARLQ